MNKLRVFLKFRFYWLTRNKNKEKLIGTLYGFNIKHTQMIINFLEKMNDVENLERILQKRTFPIEALKALNNINSIKSDRVIINGINQCVKNKNSGYIDDFIDALCVRYSHERFETLTAYLLSNYSDYGLPIDKIKHFHKKVTTSKLFFDAPVNEQDQFNMVYLKRIINLTKQEMENKNNFDKMIAELQNDNEDKAYTLHCPTCAKQSTLDDVTDDFYDQDDGWIIVYHYRCNKCHSKIVDGNGNLVITKVIS